MGTAESRAYVSRHLRYAGTIDCACPPTRVGFDFVINTWRCSTCDASWSYQVLSLPETWFMV